MGGGKGVMMVEREQPGLLGYGTGVGSTGRRCGQRVEEPRNAATTVAGLSSTVG